jgi:hypothetical protein
VSALAEMYVQGVSTRKVKAVTETLCGHSFSASSVSEMKYYAVVVLNNRYVLQYTQSRHSIRPFRR